MANIAGKTPADEKLWHTYLYWARLLVDPATAHSRVLKIARADQRLGQKQQEALQAILFTSFALEFRIKRLFEELGVRFRKRDTLGSLLEVFKTRFEAATRLDDNGPIHLPAGWPRLEKRLKKLAWLRNQIAHANYHEVRAVLSNRPRRAAAAHFNALAEFIRVTNLASNYERDSAQARQTARLLRVRVK